MFSEGLWYRILVFIDDLKNFNEVLLLQNYRDFTYMSETYFTIEEISMLKSIKIEGITLEESIQKLYENKKFICSSHDLKPVYEKYFKVKKSDMNKKNIKIARLFWKTWV